MKLLWRSPYDKLLDDENDEISKSSPIRDETSKVIWRSYFVLLLPWVLTLFFASIALIEHLSQTQVSSLGSYSTGWETDLAAARPYIKTEQVRFTGAPAFDENGQSYTPHPGPTEYNGEGSEIDQAWEELTKGRYIRITEEEAHDAWGEDISAFWEPMANSYVAGLDMFHTLHCVNRLRKLTHEDLTEIKNNHNARAHHYHCLTQIRQYVMCAGDLTVVPTRHYPGIGRNYIDSDVVHTCRNFEALRGWLWERYNGSLAVEAQDPA